MSKKLKPFAISLVPSWKLCGRNLSTGAGNPGHQPPDQFRHYLDLICLDFSSRYRLDYWGPKGTQALWELLTLIIQLGS